MDELRQVTVAVESVWESARISVWESTNVKANPSFMPNWISLVNSLGYSVMDSVKDSLDNSRGLWDV